MPDPVSDKSGAARVRDRFTATLNKRLEHVAGAIIKQAEKLVDDYFNNMLAAGKDPYPIKHEAEPAKQEQYWQSGHQFARDIPPVFKQVAEVPLFDAATDFASGNNPELKADYDLVAAAPTEWAAIIERVKLHHEKAGFTVYFGTDVKDPAKIVLRVHDPEFQSAVNTTLQARD
jgi:hypothetical protein